MTQLFYRVRSVHAVTFGQTGHMHAETARDHEGRPRLVLNCSVCEPYAHVQDWSNKPADVLLTWDEEQQANAALANQGKLTPEILEMIARVVAELNGRVLPQSTLQPTITEDLVMQAVRAELAKQGATQPALRTASPVDTLRTPAQQARPLTIDGRQRQKPGPKPGSRRTAQLVEA